MSVTSREARPASGTAKSSGRSSSRRVESSDENAFRLKPLGLSRALAAETTTALSCLRFWRERTTTAPPKRDIRGCDGVVCPLCSPPRALSLSAYSTLRKSLTRIGWVTLVGFASCSCFGLGFLLANRQFQSANREKKKKSQTNSLFLFLLFLQHYQESRGMKPTEQIEQ